ncbi:MAG: sugar phosphate isomerase/epimerase [Luteolibacter sp.]|jgi:sugar phosphate isomerase/epimerase|nr:sugar phosphate isomerase/epimerase [Luteolibacter sp.]
MKSTAATTLAFSQAGNLFAAGSGDPYLSNIGIQLYTLRNQIATDAPATLKVVAAAGYKQVEPYGFPKSDAMISAAKDAGLAIHSAHFEWDSVVHPKDEAMSDFSKILETAQKIGLSHLVIPYVLEQDRKTLDGYKKLAENFNKAAALAAKAGIQLAYHNHNFEFDPKEGGKSGYDIFIEEFSPAMMFEVDIFWVKLAGIDPVELIKKLKGRVSQLHLKDLKDGIPMPKYAGELPVDAFKELGNGIIPMPPILAAAKEARVKHCHVEQDQSPDPLASIRQSAAFLAKL